MSRLTTTEYGAFCSHINTPDCDNCEDCKWWLAIVEKLARYEDLEEQGRLIEIVRCRDCEHYNTDGCSEGCGWCEKLNIGSFDDVYCDKASLAELKGTEE